MASLPALLRGLFGDARDAAVPGVDGQEGSLRLSRRSEAYVQNLFNGLQASANEGSLFVAQTATPGTGITASSATGTTYADTQGILTVDNTDGGVYAGGSGKRIILDSITLVITTAPTASTSLHVAHRIDKANRGSAGTVLYASATAIQAVNMDSGAVSVGSVRFGVPTIAAASGNVRNVCRQVVRSAIPILYDVYIFKFGAQEAPGGAQNLALATAGTFIFHCPPIIIGPGQSYVLNEWSPARTGAYSAECTVTWIER